MSEQFHVEERKSEHVDSSGNWGGGEEKRLKATGNWLSVLFVEKRKNVSAGVEHVRLGLVQCGIFEWYRNSELDGCWR